MNLSSLFFRIEEARKNIYKFINQTPLEFSDRLSYLFKTNIYLKREDLNKTRSFKIRGALNKILNILSNTKIKNRTFVTASAGNHAQGVAFTCSRLNIKGIIFVPATTPFQKINRIKYFGNGYVECRVVGNNFSETEIIAKNFASKNKFFFVHPFNDYEVIAGQGTIAYEILNNLSDIDYIIIPVGGGGLISGIATYIKYINSKIKIIGVEPKGAASMLLSLRKNRIITLENLDNFVDGVAVRRIGSITFNICKKFVDKFYAVDEGAVAKAMIDLYQNEGIIAEPAGALSVAVLELIKRQIVNKNIVCLISGGNNDILRYPEILERSLIYEGKKHYFLIEFAQKPGQLKKFVNNVLGPDDDIVLFEYIKNNNKEKGPVLVGIELQNKNDLKNIIRNLKKFNFNFKKINLDDPLYIHLLR